ncbi:hypothetical protein JTB14_023946 [Gonioctena quinquepunctata]|nr:hypothetical protein JTB14_023946 [Gonioctena quinquepunctata]
MTMNISKKIHSCTDVFEHDWFPHSDSDNHSSLFGSDDRSMVLIQFHQKSLFEVRAGYQEIEGITKSPVFSHLSATIEGLTTVRAFEAEKILIQEFDKHQDYHTSALYMSSTASSAFGFSLDMCSSAFYALLIFSFLIFQEHFESRGGGVGLAITQATTVSATIQWVMRMYAEVTNLFISVERVLEYEVLPKEIQPAVPKILPKSWPSDGEIRFENIGLRYAVDGPLILKKMNLVIKSKEKIGIVGRTGAGKSSLISALFRLALVEGEIEIDGIHTSDVKLETLRAKLSIIPQDPVLFSGTLRHNLDPFEDYSDDTLYKAIGDVELKDAANVINRLESKVTDKGANYSIGQRQLICLARAILKNNKILILDEATANVDPQTDALIQNTIRKKFVDCTILTIAHRLNTIMDSDKVLVIDAGRIREFDHPHILLQNTKSLFHKMVMKTERNTSEQLRGIAAESFKRITNESQV